MGAVLLVVGLLVLATAVVLALRSRKSPPSLPSAPETSVRSIEPAHAATPAKLAAPVESVPKKPASSESPVVAVPAPAEATALAEPQAVVVEPPAQVELVAPVSVASPEIPRGPSLVPTKRSANRDLTALKKGLESTRGGWVARLVGLFGGKKEVDPQLLEEIQETLLTGDVGPKTTERLTEVLKERLGRQDMTDENVVWSTLQETAREVIDVQAGPFGAKAEGKTPLVILVVGVNGVGKTTTIGKLASRYKEQGKKVYLAAGDTFRAAAVAQLEAWGKRVGVTVVKGKDLTKPSAVVFDAVQTGAKEGADVVIADTAGRLHTKTPLMDELRKLRDAAAKALPGAPHEILLVLDATTGQNGIIQVREFREALDLTGIVLTKLDGTAKGGIILGICDEFKLPVRFVGVGEKVDDLREFDAADFTAALFARPTDDDTAAA